jgi:hypothetical protein
MRTYLAITILSLCFAGCVGQRFQQDYPEPIMAEFVVTGVSAGPVVDAETARRIAMEYLLKFDDSGDVQLKSEKHGEWVFAAQAGDFTAIPVTEIIIRKDGSRISQGDVGPIVRLSEGKWIYDKRQDRNFRRGLERT